MRHIHYDPASDRLVVHFCSATEIRAEELREDLFLLSDPKGKLIGFEVRRAGRHVDLSNLETTSAGASRGAWENAPAPPHEPPDQVTIYSDGACIGNPGPGGWAARLLYPDGRIAELGGAAAHTTNNRMELKAAIEGLKKAGKGPAVSLVTDSEYLRQGITAWIHGWKRRGWLTASKQPVLNQDLWQELDRLNGAHIAWKYTRGHAGNPDNERCDTLAQAFARGKQPELLTG